MTAARNLAAFAETITNLVATYGAKGDGVTDDTTAVQAAITAGGNIYCPPGTYVLSGQLVHTMATTTESFSLIGAGAELTKFVWASGNGLKINFINQLNSVHIRDICFQTSTTNTGNAIWLNQTAATIANPANSALSDITGVVCRGSDSYAGSYYWNTGIYIYGVSNVNITNSQITGTNTALGTGVVVTGTASLPPVICNIQGCVLDYLAYGVSYGAYCEGMTINACNFTGGAVGVFVASGLAAGLDQLMITNSQFECTNFGVDIRTYIPNTQILNNLFLVGFGGANSCVGINLEQCGLYNLVSNSFNSAGNGSGNIGIQIQSTQSSYPGTVVGNVLSGMSGYGVALLSTSNRVTMIGNVYTGNGVNILNSSTNNVVFDAGYTYTVATLPTVATNAYMNTFVSDSTVAASGNFGAIVAGSGANKVPVYSDGTNWRIG